MLCLTLVVLTLFPVLQLQPFRSGNTLHSSPSIHGCIWHHHFCATIEAAQTERKTERKENLSTLLTLWELPKRERNMPKSPRIQDFEGCSNEDWEEEKTSEDLSLTSTVKRNETMSLYLFHPKTMRLVREEVFDSKLTDWIHQSDVGSTLTVCLSG